MDNQEEALARKQLDEFPIFQVIEKGQGSKHYKIWRDGRIEGFGDNPCICNLTGAVIGFEVAIALEKAERNFSVRRAIWKGLQEMASRMARLPGKALQGLRWTAGSR